MESIITAYIPHLIIVVQPDDGGMDITEKLNSKEQALFKMLHAAAEASGATDHIYEGNPESTSWAQRNIISTGKCLRTELRSFTTNGSW